MNKNINKNNKLQELRLNPEWAKLTLFDRKGWQRLPFGAFAESINERVDPSAAGDEIYVGLEHLDPQDLHIRRWGKGSDVIGTKLRFRKGDLIFGRRRAYQRKLAVAEFDGICSAHAMVVRAKPERVLPEFLPFLMMSDRFMKRAVEISVGSLSPTINWKTLKLEEFDLPPLDQQRRIAEMLWEVDKTIKKYDVLANAAIDSKTAFVEEHFGRNNGTTAGMQSLATLATVSYGITLGSYRTTLPETRPYLRVANVQRDNFDLSEIKIINCTEEEARRNELISGDVLVVEGHANVSEIGRSAVWRSQERGTLHQNHLIRARCSESLLPEYLNIYINSAKGQEYFRRRAKSSSGLNTINSTVVKELPIPSTTIDLQNRFITEIDQFNVLLRSVQQKNDALKHTLQTALNIIVI